jgi:hypothetical protein
MEAGFRRSTRKRKAGLKKAGATIDQIDIQQK